MIHNVLLDLRVKAVARIFVRGDSPSPSLLPLPSTPLFSPPLLFLPLPGALPHYQLGGLGSAVSSPSGVRGGAPAANAF